MFDKVALHLCHTYLKRGIESMKRLDMLHTCIDIRIQYYGALVWIIFTAGQQWSDKYSNLNQKTSD